jgi:hypothetical protein
MANDVAGSLAQRMRAGARPIPESRRPRGPRDTKRSDWRVGRAGSITSGVVPRSGVVARGVQRRRLFAYSDFAHPRQGWPPEGSRRRAFDRGSTRSATARPGVSGRRSYVNSTGPTR